MENLDGTTPNRYDLFSEMDADKFFEFIIQFFENMGMRELDLPLNCSYCPLKRECNRLEDTEITCLEFLAERLR